MSDSVEHPVEILWRMQNEAMAAGHVLPEQSQGDPKWGGLAFGVGDLNLITELTSVVDVLDCPVITPVPGTQPWVKGICNVRGKLYSVVDFGLFLGVAAPVSGNEGKLLVINDDDLGCTLLVPRIFGLRYFVAQQQGKDKSVLDASVQPFIDRTFVQGDLIWGVLAVDRLISDTDFLNVQRNVNQEG
jgi:twitching motility protein PilI